MAFTQKLLEFDITLATGNFQGAGNSATITGHRASCKIVKAGGTSQGEAQVSIFGLPLSTMNQLSTFGRTITTQLQNTIVIKAGDAASGMSVVYQGSISAAFMDANSMPDVAFRITAHVTAYAAAKPIPVTSVRGKADVAQVMQSIAGQMGIQFENNGISASLMNPYLPGTAWQQVRALAQHAGIEMVVDCGTLAIWKAGTARQGDTTIISPSTGLVGYPAFNSAGVVLKTLWQPSLKYGALIEVQSDLQAACGQWAIYRLEYELDSLVPKGNWFCIVDACPPQDLATDSVVS